MSVGGVEEETTAKIHLRFTFCLLGSGISESRIRSGHMRDVAISRLSQMHLSWIDSVRSSLLFSNFAGLYFQRIHFQII